MDVFPTPTVTRFAQLEAGDLFLYVNDQIRYYALKTMPVEGDAHLVTLGPTFAHDVTESFLLNPAPATVLSFSKAFTILLPTDPGDWARSGRLRQAVCLAVCDDRIYFCTNAASSPLQYLPCFVDVSTGELRERLPGTSLYTNNWSLAVAKENHSPRVILQYPLVAPARP